MNRAERWAARSEDGQTPNADGTRRGAVIHVKETGFVFEPGNAADALRQLDDMIRSSPDSPILYYYKATILAELKKYKSAANCCRQALRIDKNYGLAYGEMGLILRRCGKPAKSILYFNKAIKLTKGKGSSDELFALYNNKGAALIDMRKCEEAIRWYDKAIDIDPSRAKSYVNKCFALLFIERTEEAKECLATATKIDPEFTSRAIAQVRAQADGHQIDAGDFGNF